LAAYLASAQSAQCSTENNGGVGRRRWRHWLNGGEMRASWAAASVAQPLKISIIGGAQCAAGIEWRKGSGHGKKNRRAAALARRERNRRHDSALAQRCQRQKQNGIKK